jgi:hypothetical protein
MNINRVMQIINRVSALVREKMATHRSKEPIKNCALIINVLNPTFSLTMNVPAIVPAN